MAKKSKSKKSSSNTSNAKNIKALINQNKMIENQNAEAEKKKQEEEAAREQAKLEAKAAKEAEEQQVVSADEIITPDEGEVSTAAVEENTEKSDEKKTDNKTKDDKKNKDAKKKPAKEKKKAGKRIKETVSELKKVSWPSFKDVVKKTGVVLAVVIFFGVVLFVFDFLLSMLYNLFQGQPIV